MECVCFGDVYLGARIPPKEPLILVRTGADTEADTSFCFGFALVLLWFCFGFACVMQLAVCDVALSCLDVRPKNLRAALATDDE